jgi:tripartite-type tricarboxylate transporter receptor subunit TctC
MQSPNRRRIMTASASLAALGWPALTRAQTVQRTARIVVGFPPGGSTDIVSRLIADKLRGSYAPQVLVENRAGAGGRVAAEAVKVAEADGTTILLTPASIMGIYPHVYRKLAYDSFADFAPVTMACSFPFAFSVGPAVPASVKTVAEFAAWAKTETKPLNYGSPGAGSMPHFTGFQIARALGVNMTHIPFKGGAPAIQDLIGGQIQASVNVIAEALPNHRAGKLRILAQTGATRSSYVSDVPTFTEAGMKEIVAREWFGFFVPAKTPPATIAALNGLIRDAIKSKEVSEGFAKFAFDPEGESPAEFAGKFRALHDQWGPIVKASGFSSDD